MEFLFLATIGFSLLYAVITIIGENRVDFKILRYIFLFIIYLSLFIPFIKYDMLLENINSYGDSIIETINSYGVVNNAKLANQDGSFVALDWLILIKFVYAFISLLLIIRVFLGFAKIYQLYSKSQKEISDGYNMLFNPKIISPFSFYKFIFIPSNLKNHKDLEFIIPHEIIHIKNYHSLDILIANLYCSFFWFNPLAWKLKSKIQLNHEYIADEGTLNLGLDRNGYQLAMISQIERSKTSILNSYFNQSIKKRIIMMSKERVSISSKYVFPKIVSAFIIILLLVGFINGQIFNGNSNNIEEVTNPDWVDLKYISMSKDDLLSFNNRITSLYKYYGLDINIRTVYYEVFSRPVEADPSSYKRTNMSFDGQLLKEIQMSEKGHKFYFDKIVVIDENGKTLNLQPVLVEINGK